MGPLVCERVFGPLSFTDFLMYLQEGSLKKKFSNVQFSFTYSSKFYYLGSLKIPTLSLQSKHARWGQKYYGVKDWPQYCQIHISYFPRVLDTYVDN